MSGRSEIRPFARLFDGRNLLNRANYMTLNDVVDWPKIVVSPLLTVECEDSFAPAEFADDMASHSVFALPYDKFVVVMGPCPTNSPQQDKCHWVSTVEKRADVLVGRSLVVGADFFRNSSGVWSFKLGDDRLKWCEDPTGIDIDEEAKMGFDPIIKPNDPEGNSHRMQVEKYFWITSIFQCVGLLSSKGVASDAVASPKAINKKREAKNLSPIFSYRVLTIDPQESANARSEVNGTHASPRLHWRRGHIRQLGDGRQIIVRPCLVGSIERGYVAKDYAVRAPTAAEGAA